MKRPNIFLLLILYLFIISCSGQTPEAKKDNPEIKKHTMAKINKSEEEWKKELTSEEYRVLRQKGTERAFTGDLYKNHEKGIYICAACGNKLFSSDQKYESGSGWPSYWQPLNDNSVILDTDNSLGMIRTEVRCARCGGHLGHVFDDGPQPTGLRYCINSVAMDFEKK